MVIEILQTNQRKQILNESLALLHSDRFILSHQYIFNTLEDKEQGKNLAKTLNIEIRKTVWGISNDCLISGY